MPRREQTRENSERCAELRRESRHTDPPDDSGEGYERLQEILRLLRTTAQTARRTAQEAAATRQESRAIRQATAATRDRTHQRVTQLLESTGSQLGGEFKLERPRGGQSSVSSMALSAAAAHEINNPLEAISGLICLLESAATLSDKDREYLAIIKGEVGRISEIAQQSLANYRQTLAPENVDVAEVIDSVLDLYEPRFRAKGIAVIREHQFRGNIRAHSRKIREVFANLFLNAIDAMNSLGRLRIRISEGHEWSAPQRSGVRILVADNGHGIAPKHLNKIFEPSFTTKGERGNGIGLSVVRNMIRAHRGTIRVRSSVRAGRSGTIFSIFLPAESRLQSVAA